MLGVIYRTFNYCNSNIILHLYTTRVRLDLDYASNIWNPYLQHLMRAVEKIQRRATKLIPFFQDYVCLL